MKEMEKYKTMGDDLLEEVAEALKYLREISRDTYWEQRKQKLRF